MHPRLSGVPIHPCLAVRVPGQSIHDGPADRTGSIDLQPEVVVQTRYGVVVLVDDEMFTPIVGI